MQVSAFSLDFLAKMFEDIEVLNIEFFWMSWIYYINYLDFCTEIFKLQKTLFSPSWYSIVQVYFQLLFWYYLIHSSTFNPQQWAYFLGYVLISSIET